MNKKDELIQRLENTLSLLKDDTQFTATVFEIDSNENLDWVKEYVVTFQKDGWSWGSCTTDNCAHNSHDPKTYGDVVTIICKPIGKDIEDRDGYILPNGHTFVLTIKDNGYHYYPNRYFSNFKVNGLEDQT